MNLVNNDKRPCAEKGCDHGHRDGFTTWLCVHQPTGRQFVLQAEPGEEGLWTMIRLHMSMPPTTPFQKLMASGSLGPEGFDFTKLEHGHGASTVADRVRAQHEKRLATR